MKNFTFKIYIVPLICFFNFFIFQNLSFAESSFTGYDIFVIAGQSNAVGVGMGEYTDPLKSNDLDKKIFQIGRQIANDKRVIPADDVLQHFGYAKTKTAIGFGMAFARRYAKTMDSDRRVLLVPAAMGGTSILQWLGELPLTSSKTDSLMDDLKSRLSTAMDAKSPAGLSLQNRFKGFLWMQGEADITKAVLKRDNMTAGGYVKRLGDLVQEVLSKYPNEKVSVVVGEPSPEWTSIGGKINLSPMKSLFRSKVIEWTLASDSRAFVSSQGEDLHSNPEDIGGGSVHYNAQSQIKLGQLFYNKYLETLKISITPDLVYVPKIPSNISSPIVPLVKVSNPALHTHEVLLPSLTPGKKVTIGFSDKGGGYINYASASGFGEDLESKNFAIWDYGKGWQGSIRDEVHGRVYNPTQAGFSDRTGALANLQSIDPRTLIVKQAGMTLWNGDATYDFVEHKEDGVIEGPYGSAQSDSDYLDEKNKSVNDEVGSEFDFSSYNRSFAAVFSIPSIEHVEYAGYVRNPSAINQFTNPLAQKKGRNDVLKNVLDESYLMKDISPEIAGNQSTTITDLSNIKTEVMGVRLTNNFHYAHFYTNKGWSTNDLSSVTSKQGLYSCKIPLQNKLSFLKNDNKKTIINTENNCDLKYEVLILSTNLDPKQGFAVGLYVPKNDDLNKNQIVVANISTGNIVRTEDRRIDFSLTMDYETPRGGFFAMRARHTLSGLLSPLSISQQFNDNRRYSEFLRNKSYILFGTPQEIIDAIARTRP